MNQTPEQLDELIHRVQAHGDLSDLHHDQANTSSVNLVSILSNIPKASVPQPNLMRVREKVLDKISLPVESASENKLFAGFSLLRTLPRFIRITGGLVGIFTIMLSLTIGTAVAALESIPGQSIYPLKKMVEKVQLQLAHTEEQKTNLQIKFANTRVDELETILQKQKEGKVSGAQVQKVVADTVKNLEATSKVVADQSKQDPKVVLLTKIVSLSNKQTAVIQAAQIQSEGEVSIELAKALESSMSAKELAIENIEKAGLIVEDGTVIEIPKNENTILAEGKLTASTATYLTIGTAQFLLTDDTEYANIKPEDLKVDMMVKIIGEVKDKKTYALKIEFIKPQTSPEPTETTEDTEDNEEAPGTPETPSSPDPQ